MRRITRDQARRFALEAQGFTRQRPTGRIDVRHFRRTVNDIWMVQLDSVNVFSRTHYMPFFSRLGPYDRSALDNWLWKSGELFEYWGHEASLIPVEDHRFWRWLMDRPLRWNRYHQLEESEPGYVDGVLEQVRGFGPLTASDLKDPGQRDGTQMWGWSKGKVALEALFANGKITTAHRPSFQRIYDLTERVVDPVHLGQPEIGKEEAQKGLILKAARAMGVANAEDLGDYPRISMPEARPLIAELAKAGSLVEVDVDGWSKPGYLHPDATLPRRSSGTALLSPFDNLVWCRPRTERLWDFHYRIEIYVPEPKRVFGYYVLPFLLNGDLVARVDLKTDRKAGRLLVKGAFGEDGVDRAHVGRMLRNELETVASWLGMDEVEIFDNGDLAPFLK